MSLKNNRSTLINLVAELKVSLTILHFCDLKFDMILQGVIQFDSVWYKQNYHIS